MDDGFGVALRREAVAATDELGAQLAIVVDLAVERDPISPVFVGHWLAAAVAEIDDAQPAVSQPGTAGDVNALAVRTAMREGGAPCSTWAR